MVDNPSDFLSSWSRQIGAELKDGLRESPGWIAFALENGTVYHTYTVMAPDPFVAPYFSFLLERTPKPQSGEAGDWRKDDTRTERNRGYGLRSRRATGSSANHEFGGAEGIRTPDLCRARAALSQLSYRPGTMVTPRRFAV